ncbi:MAG: hypothetical protein ACOCR6_00610 [archaeon]
MEEKLRGVIQPPENEIEAHETIDGFAEHTQRLKENDLREEASAWVEAPVDNREISNAIY